MTAEIRILVIGSHAVSMRSVALPRTWCTSGLRGTVMMVRSTPWTGAVYGDDQARVGEFIDPALCSPRVEARALEGVSTPRPISDADDEDPPIGVGEACAGFRQVEQAVLGERPTVLKSRYWVSMSGRWTLPLWRSMPAPPPDPTSWISPSFGVPFGIGGTAHQN